MGRRPRSGIVGFAPPWRNSGVCSTLEPAQGKVRAQAARGRAGERGMSLAWGHRAIGPSKPGGSPGGASPGTVMLLCTHPGLLLHVMNLGCQAPWEGRKLFRRCFGKHERVCAFYRAWRTCHEWSKGPSQPRSPQARPLPGQTLSLLPLRTRLL